MSQSIDALLPVLPHEDAETVSSVRAAVLYSQQGKLPDQCAAGLDKQVKNATALLDQSLSIFETAHTKLFKRAKEVSETSRTVSQTTRKAANDLAEGLQRIEKIANFDALERRVALLERIASAMKTLAEIESSGKLEKIVSAIK